MAINTDPNDNTTPNFRTNHNNQPHISKEAEEDMPAPPKKGRPSEKNPVSVGPSTGMIDTRRAVSPATDESMEDCIVVGLERSARPEAGVATLGLSTLMKPRTRARPERQTSYGASALVVDTLEARLKGANAQWATEKDAVKGQDGRDQRVDSQVRAIEPRSYEEAVRDPLY